MIVTNDKEPYPNGRKVYCLLCKERILPRRKRIKIVPDWPYYGRTVIPGKRKRGGAMQRLTLHLGCWTKVRKAIEEVREV